MSATEYAKPLPKPSPMSEPFWEAARRHELWLQRCTDCGQFVFYPRPQCPNCWSAKLEWKPASGRGKIYSYTVVRRPTHRAFTEPYVLAIVELEEGVRMTTNIVAAPEQVRVGMGVNVLFDDVTPDRTLVKFKPA